MMCEKRQRLTSEMASTVVVWALSIPSVSPNHVADGESARDPYADHHDGRHDEEAAAWPGVLHDLRAYNVRHSWSPLNCGMS